MSDEVKRALQEGKITEGHARLLINLDEDTQKEIFNEILTEKLTVRQTEKVLKNMAPHEKLPFFGNVQSNEDSDEEEKKPLLIQIPSYIFDVLSRRARSKKMRVEKYCELILEKEARNP